MLYGCLTLSLLPVLAFWLYVSCGWLGWIAYVAGLVAMTWLVRWRQHRVVRQEGALLGITNMQIRPCRGFVTPGELPWYRGWSCYDVEADDPEGFRREYNAYLTWTWFGFLGITVSFSTIEEYDCYDAQGNRIYPSSLVGERSEPPTSEATTGRV